MTIVLARELERFGVRVERDRTGRAHPPHRGPDGRRRADDEGEGALDPANVAAAVGWLASDLSDGVTGQVVKIQGGVVPDRPGLAAGHRRSRATSRGRSSRSTRSRDELFAKSDPGLPPFLLQTAEADTSVHLAWGDRRSSRSATSCVAFLDEHAPPEVLRGFDFAGRRRRGATTEIIPRVGARLAGDALRPRLDDPRLPARARRAERTPVQTLVYLEEMARAPHPPLAALPRVRDRGAEPARVRQRRADATLVPGRDPRRHDLVHRHERAERRVRPRRAPDPRRARRRPLHRQRPEGVDELRDGRAEVLRVRAHRSRRAEAQGHQPADRRHGHARHRGAAAATHQRCRATSPRCSSPTSRCRRRTSSGGLNDGWRITQGSLAHERAGLWVEGVCRLEATRATARSRSRSGAGSTRDAGVRRQHRGDLRAGGVAARARLQGLRAASRRARRRPSTRT